MCVCTIVFVSVFVFLSVAFTFIFCSFLTPGQKTILIFIPDFFVSVYTFVPVSVVFPFLFCTFILFGWNLYIIMSSTNAQDVSFPDFGIFHAEFSFLINCQDFSEKKFWILEFFILDFWILEFFMLSFLFSDKLSRFLWEEMYSGIHVFSLANILKTGRESTNGVKDSIYKNRRKTPFTFHPKTLFPYFQDFEGKCDCELSISICSFLKDTLNHCHYYWYIR